MKLLFFGFGEWMKGLMGQCLHLQNFWARTAPAVKTFIEQARVVTSYALLI